MQVLRLLVKLYKDSANPDWVSICQCLMFLGDAAEVARILHQLLKGEDVSSVCCSRFELCSHCLDKPFLTLMRHIIAVRRIGLVAG